MMGLRRVSRSRNLFAASGLIQNLIVCFHSIIFLPVTGSIAKAEAVSRQEVVDY